jgi:hypothetical protein
MVFSVSGFASPFFMGEWATGYRLRSYFLSMRGSPSFFQSVVKAAVTVKHSRNSTIHSSQAPPSQSSPLSLASSSLSLDDLLREPYRPSLPPDEAIRAPFSLSRQSHHGALLSLPRRRAGRRSSRCHLLLKAADGIGVLLSLQRKCGYGRIRWEELDTPISFPRRLIVRWRTLKPSSPS